MNMTYMTVLGQRYWLVLGGTWSVWGVTDRYLVVLGQYRAVLVILGQYGAVLAGTWWNWVSMGR